MGTNHDEQGVRVHRQGSVLAGGELVRTVYLHNLLCPNVRDVPSVGRVVLVVVM
jgi:hypothetical protein